MKSLVVGEDNKNYGEIRSNDKKNISRLSAAGSKKTPLCYSKVKKCGLNSFHNSWPLAQIGKQKNSEFLYQDTLLIFRSSKMKHASRVEAAYWVTRDVMMDKSKYFHEFVKFRVGNAFCNPSLSIMKIFKRITWSSPFGHHANILFHLGCFYPQVKGRNLNQSSVKIRTEHFIYMYHAFHDQSWNSLQQLNFFLQNDTFLNDPASNVFLYTAP